MAAFFSKLNRLVGKLEEVSIGLALLACTFLILVNVILRFFFKAGLVWSDEMVRFLMIYITFVGCSVCVRADNHIAVDILGMLLKGKTLKALQVVINIICLVFSAAMTYFGVLLVQRSISNPQLTAGLRIPMFIPYLSLVIGFGLMAIRYLQELVGKIRGRDYFREDRKKVVDEDTPPAATAEGADG